MNFDYDPRKNLEFEIYSKSNSKPLKTAIKLLKNHCWLDNEPYSFSKKPTNEVSFDLQGDKSFYIRPIESESSLYDITVSSKGRDGKTTQIDFKVSGNSFKIRINNTNYTLNGFSS